MSVWQSDGTGIGRYQVEPRKPWPFTTPSTRPNCREHTVSGCPCGDRHSPLEITQLNQVAALGVLPPPTSWPLGSPKLSRQQDHTGWLRTAAMPTGSGVRDLLGTEHWAPEQQPDPQAPQVCWCGAPIVGKPGKRYCKPSHRVRASERRRAVVS